MRSALTAALITTPIVSHAAVVAGDIINGNFGIAGNTTPSGAAVIGSAGDFWNNAFRTAGGSGGVSATGLLLTDGTTNSGVGFSISNGAGNGSIYSTANPDVFEGDIFITTATPFITISGLAGATIDLYIYAASGSATGQGSTFTFGSTALSTTDTAGVETGYTNGVNYVKFSGLVADSSGNISGTWMRRVATYGVINGFQIMVVPEPSTVLLGALGLLALMRRRR